MHMYEKPRLTRFGTFRELTLVGPSGDNDGYFVCGVHCHDELVPPPTEPGAARS